MTKRPQAVVFDPLSWVADFSYEVERDLLDASGIDLIVPVDRSQRHELVAEADIVVSAGVDAVSAADIARFVRCAGIVVAQSGLEHVDLDAAAAAGLPVVNVSAAIEEVADHALALTLAAIRRLPSFQAAADRRDWDLDGAEVAALRRIRGQVLGIIGPGQIGRAVAQRAGAFGFEVIATSRRSRPGAHRGTVTVDAAAGIELVPLSTLLARADVIVVCADANPTSVGLLDEAAFSRAKKGVVVVNVSRGALIDEAALATALDEGIVAMAALDVRHPEPPDPSTDRLTGHPRVIQTPHVAGGSREALQDLHRLTAEGVAGLLHRAGRVERVPRPSAEPDVTGVHHVDEFEPLARERLSEATYGYVAGGAGQEGSVRRNREALDAILLVPRVMRNVRQVDTGVEVLGVKSSLPLVVAPSAVQRMAHPDGELATARAARDEGLTMILSMNASTTMEDVAAEGVDFWMQLYFSEDRAHMRSVLERAETAGAGALCVTVDHAGMPTRLRELHRPLVIPPEVRFVHLDEDPGRRGIDRSLGWDVIEWVRGVSPLPLILKGILHPDDARLAAELGVDGVIVSNHGGRQLDGAVSAYDVLPGVVAAVEGRTEIFVDGGIRSGTDLLKALALGARAGLVGRPIWWGLAAAGQGGVARVLALIRRDFEEAMRLCGCSDLSAIGPSLLFDPS